MLQALRVRIGVSGREVRRAINHLFLFIGAEPNTDWLSGSGIALGPKGFILAGADAGDGRFALETSRRGVFAIGDVRAKSVKRVAAAVGEGAQVVASLHSVFGRRVAPISRRRGSPRLKLSDPIWASPCRTCRQCTIRGAAAHFFRRSDQAETRNITRR